MAPEKWLINARALMEYARNQKSGTIDCNDIARFPTVDAVEVVRCKDCAFWDGDRRCNGRRNGLVMEFTDGDDFCSYGERRTDNGKI